jgi:hypothetical protein
MKTRLENEDSQTSKIQEQVDSKENLDEINLSSKAKEI